MLQNKITLSPCSTKKSKQLEKMQFKLKPLFLRYFTSLYFSTSHKFSLMDTTRQNVISRLSFTRMFHCHIRKRCSTFSCLQEAWKWSMYVFIIRVSLLLKKVTRNKNHFLAIKNKLNPNSKQTSKTASVYTAKMDKTFLTVKILGEIQNES